jgi:hypothetical protein
MPTTPTNLDSQTPPTTRPGIPHTPVARDIVNKTVPASIAPPEPATNDNATSHTAEPTTSIAEDNHEGIEAQDLTKTNDHNATNMPASCDETGSASDSISDSASQISTQAIGLYVNAVEAQTVIFSDETRDQTPETNAQQQHAIPPSVLVPRFTGEPLRADMSWPPRPRGTGEAWPPEARIVPGKPTGRLTLGYAWPLLAEDHKWSWQFEDKTKSVHPADAIAFVAATIAGLRRQRTRLHTSQTTEASRISITNNGKSTDTTSNAPSVGLVVPGHLNELAQQRLTDAGHKLKLNLNLLPRPVASAITWCKEYANELEDTRSVRTGPIGSVMTLHLGLDEWEVGLVDIIPHHCKGTTTFIPSRRRDCAHVMRSYGIELLHRLAIRSLEMSYQQVSPARVWELMWCTPWMHTVLAQLAGDENADFPKIISLARHARRSEFLIQQCRQATQRIFRTEESVPALLRSVLGQSPQFTDIRDWFMSQSKRLAKESLLGAVITGPMTMIPQEKETLATHYLAKLWPKPQRVLIAGDNISRKALADSAARFAQHVSHRDSNPPLFIDHTTDYRIAGRIDGKPAWVHLFDEETRAIAGGETHARNHPLSGLPIQPHHNTFKLAVHCDSWPTVRIAVAKLPQQLYQPESVNLHVQHRPGHGFPTVELVPKRQGLFGRHRVFVNFRKTTDTKQSPAEFLTRIAKK